MTFARSKSLAVGLGDRVVGVEGVLDDPHLGAVHAALLLVLDLDRLDHEFLARRDLDGAWTAGAADERRDLDLPLVLARLAAQNRRARR